MQNSQSIIFLWTQIYEEIFKSALVYLQPYSPKDEKFIPLVVSKKQVCNSLTYCDYKTKK